ncbi:hypothetical protein F5Y14DRAFT_457467 [Nemania sp. NC0429]|nr:hypothetical protein F5Y14DRAFT_457467 [Nemania sp. NC0429]
MPPALASAFTDKLDALKKAQVISKNARLSIARPPRIEWVQSGQLRLVSQKTVTSTAALSKVMHAAISKASKCLKTLLMQTHQNHDTDMPSYDCPVPSLDHISDDRSNCVLWHSFLDHSANQKWVSNACVHLITKVDRDPALQTH